MHPFSMQPIFLQVKRQQEVPSENVKEEKTSDTAPAVSWALPQLKLPGMLAAAAKKQKQHDDLKVESSEVKAPGGLFPLEAEVKKEVADSNEAEVKKEAALSSTDMDHMLEQLG